MGLFDTIYCEYPLPDVRHQGLEFQTKDLESALDHYTITQDGRLMLHARRFGNGPDRDIEWAIHGDVSFYTHEASAEKSWIEYVARFTHGRVEWIRPVEEARQAPGALPPRIGWGLPPETPRSIASAVEPNSPSPPGEIAPGAEAALLLSLRRDRHELERLLQECSNHWGYEDPVYRFYHQSFKVYGLQRSIQSIVDRLRALAPDLPLNLWFVEIVQSGTGKHFKPEDNGHWPEVTRPILEAFFHARFFLEMAVRYADLEAPPNPLPSGYAALLYLFGLR
jgi:hypothetical protein